MSVDGAREQRSGQEIIFIQLSTLVVDTIGSFFFLFYSSSSWWSTDNEVTLDGRLG
jgi:hypothetical protein